MVEGLALLFVTKVSHEMAAEIASAVCNEVQAAFGDSSVEKLPSAKLVNNMHRAFVTGHSASGTRSALEQTPMVMASLNVTTIENWAQ